MHFSKIIERRLRNVAEGRRQSNCHPERSAAWVVVVVWEKWRRGVRVCGAARKIRRHFSHTSAAARAALRSG